MGQVYVHRIGGSSAYRVSRDSSSGDRELSVFDAVETDFDKECEAFLHCKLAPRRRRTVDGKGIYELDSEELAEAVKQAREFVEVHLPRVAEAKELAKQESDGRLIAPGERELRLYYRLLDNTAHTKLLKLTKERLETELKFAIGGAAGLQGLVSWRTGPYRRFDSTAFKAAHPRLYGEFVKETRVRSFRLL